MPVPNKNRNTAPTVIATERPSAETTYWSDRKKWSDRVARIDFETLEKLSMDELRSLSDCLGLIGNVASAISCRPHCQDNGPDGFAQLNDVGTVIDGLTGFIASYRDTVLRYAKASRPVEVSEVAARAWAIVGYEADMGDCMLDLAATVADENKALATAKSKARSS